MKKYPSRYSPDKLITGHQFIVELICEKRAKILDKNLPIKFWEFQEWRTYFVYQSKLCSDLRERYSEEAIIKGIQDPTAFRLYSLKSPMLAKIIAKHQETIDKNAKKIKKDVEFVEKPTFRQDVKKKGTLDKLRELDGEEEN